MKCVLCSLPSKEFGSAYLGLDFLLSTAISDPVVKNNYEFLILPMENKSLDLISEQITKERPSILGFSCYVWNFLETLSVAHMVKEYTPEVKIILGGPEVYSISQKILSENPFIDIVVEGEGEFIFTEILHYFLFQKPTLEEIPGITFRQNGRIYSNKNKLIKNLDEIPSPYKWLKGVKKKVIGIETSRGCIFRCNYCMWHKNSYIRSFSIERIKEDLEICFSYKPKRINIVDAAFNVNKNRLKEIARATSDIRKYKTDLFIQAEAEFIDEEQISLFKELNVGLLEIGLQTITPEAQRNIGKVVDLDRFKKGVKLLNKSGLSYSIDLIWGLPGDNFNSFKKAIDFAYSILGPRSILLFHLLRVLPGSHFYKYPQKYKLVFEEKPPHRVISNYTYSSKEIKKTTEYIQKLVDNNPWMTVFTKEDIME